MADPTFDTDAFLAEPFDPDAFLAEPPPGDARKAADAKLREAQEELRAVLTVPQEATAVLFGFLP